MSALDLFSLPLPAHPPSGYGYASRPLSLLSTVSAFKTGIDQRDIFLGVNCCVICGEDTPILEHCHIVRQSEPKKWLDLQRRRWIPSQAKEHVEHEPRNGLLMCPTHHKAFDAYEFFIRYMPEARKFVFFNHTEHRGAAQFHGKAIALDIGHRYAPFPALFILHELRVRAHNPFHSTFQSPDEIQWQDWITSSGILNTDSTHGFFDSNPRPSPAPATSSMPPQQPQFPMQQGDTSVSSDGPVLGLDSATIYKILAATRESASWKACVMEGTSWDGTADENREKYQALFGPGGGVGTVTRAEEVREMDMYM